jgi:hypothetical protein
MVARGAALSSMSLVSSAVISGRSMYSNKVLNRGVLVMCPASAHALISVVARRPDMPV